MCYKCHMLRLATILLFAISPAMAQIEPDAEHYAAARNMLAMQEAVSRLKAQAAQNEADAIMRELARQQAESERMADLRFLDVHAARVQRWAGVRRASILPGNGWHEVRRCALKE